MSRRRLKKGRYKLNLHRVCGRGACGKRGSTRLVRWAGGAGLIRVCAECVYYIINNPSIYGRAWKVL